ncbi:E3 ubiquitin-protein ligase rad18 [Podila epicladia]|nr:E3 ubiquitin-protein ligase rad18 [Podila epicladia]
MDFDITDPSDWPKEFGPLREIDSHLRCPICKEYLRAAMMLQCHHNFCSECIRRHLDKESTCPACRVSTSTSQLRRNVSLEEIANNFGDIRQLLLKTVRESLEPKSAPVQTLERAESMDIDDFIPQQKRRRISARVGKALPSSQRGRAHESDDNDHDDDFAMHSQDSLSGRKYSTRSSTRPVLRSRGGRSETTPTEQAPNSQSASSSQPISYSLSQEHTSTSEQASPTPSKESIFKHTLVACPVCAMAIPEAHTNSHLDKYCFSGKQDPIYNVALSVVETYSSQAITAYEKDGSSKSASLPASPQRNTLQSAFSSSPVRFNGFAQQPSKLGTQSGATTIPEPKRLPKLTYSVLNDKQLRKKLQELGLPTHGDKQLMQKRHAEYLTLYNANCDSTRPQTIAQLHKAMDNWERTYMRDLNAKDAQRRAQEEQQQKYAQELAQQKQQEDTASPDATNLPSSQSSNSGTTSTGFVPNQANNNDVNAAIASQAAQAHKLKNADSYNDLIADIRRRQQREKEAKAKAALEANDAASAPIQPPPQEL